VVTGTLPAGRIEVGDELVVAPSGSRVRVRGLQSLGRERASVDAVARVAVNLRGVDAHELHRGDALLAPGRFSPRRLIDARLDGDRVHDLPGEVMLHIGSAAISAGVRALGTDTLRLMLHQPLPLRIGDRGLLRDPGRHRILGGLTVLDVAPPSLRRRGAAAARARVLDALTGVPDEGSELRRRRVARRTDLARMGVRVARPPRAGDWLVDDEHWAGLVARLPDVVDGWVRAHPLESGPPLDVVRRALDLPDLALVSPLVTAPLAVRDGRVVRPEQQSILPPRIAAAVDQVRQDLADNPFGAPEASRLAQLGLGPREIAAGVRAGSLLLVADGIVLLPTSISDATSVLAGLRQPFTVSEAKSALKTTRRVAVPLLELLDRRGLTRRLPDSRRLLV
jgi:selenocysteine-specific elongation factor